MTEPRSLARNTLYSGISAASSIFLIVLVIFAARILGNKAFGEFSFALAIASIFEMFTDLGLNTLTARNIPRDRELASEYLPNILGWKLILSIAAMILMIATVELLHQTTEARTAAFILGGAVLVRSYKSTSFGFFQAFERFDLILLTTYIERLSGLIFGMAALLITRRLIPFVAVFALVRIPDALITYWFVHKHITPVRFGFDRIVVRRLQTAAIPFALSSLVTVAYMNVGTVILSTFRPPTDVGWYNAGYKIYEGLTTFPFLICAVLLPRLSSLYASDRDRYVRLSLKALRYLALCSLPLVFVVYLHVPQIIRLVYGPQYAPGIVALKVLLVAAVFMFMNWVLNTILLAGNLEKTSLRIWAMGLVVMAASNLIFIRWLGMLGAAYSVATSEVCVFVLMGITAQSKLFRIPLGAMLLRPAAAGVASAGMLYLVHLSIPTVSAVLFVVTYSGMLLALGTFDPEELAMVKGLLVRPVPKESQVNTGQCRTLLERLFRW